MIECRECEKDMSSDAAACPHCGHPSKRRQRRHPFFRWLFRLALVPIVLVLGNNLHEPFHEFLKTYGGSLADNEAVDALFHFVFPVEIVTDDDKFQQELDNCLQENARLRERVRQMGRRQRPRPR